MTWRLYFLAGDLLACMVAGVSSGWLTVATLLTPLFSSFDVLMPSTLAGMAAGMVFAMAPGMVGAAIGWMEIVWGGALVGLLCLLVTYLLQAHLSGEARVR